MNSKEYIEQLQLLPHPEGGYYKEMYRSDVEIDAASLPKSFGHKCSVATGIYYLLEKDDFSAFHRIKSDEIWHHYDGGIVEIHCIDKDGCYSCLRLGKHHSGAQPMVIVPAGVWFAACLTDNNDSALMGCTVSPGFDFRDFEMARKDKLRCLYPSHDQIIDRLTRE